MTKQNSKTQKCEHLPLVKQNFPFSREKNIRRVQKRQSHKNKAVKENKIRVASQVNHSKTEFSNMISLIRTSVRSVPKVAASTNPGLFLQAMRAASSSIPNLAGHPGPTKPPTSTQQQGNPSEEARKAAELMNKLQNDPEYLKKIHDDQPMYVKPGGPDSLPGDHKYKRDLQRKSK